jgi:hypothetical protein
MTQRLDCGPFGMAAVDEEKVVVRKGDLTLARSQRENREIGGCLPGAPPPDVMGNNESCTRNIAGRPAAQGRRQWRENGRK